MAASLRRLRQFTRIRLAAQLRDQRADFLQRQLQMAFDRGGDTVVLLDRDGHITEGPGFNLFLVQNGNITTPESGVLDGMTRRTLFELCAELEIRCTATSIPATQITSSGEVFISSTAGGIIPVTTVNNQIIGDGLVGPITRALRDLYWEKRGSGWHGTPIERSS